MGTLVTTYDERLVVLSVAIAMLSSYAALDLAGRVTASRGSTRVAWLVGGAAAMGTGIWCMHFTGMLAQHLPVRVFYHVPTVVFSLLAAVGASFVALFVVSRERATAVGSAVGSLLMGAGIATMHYTGMAAMRMPAMHHYNPALWTLSVVLAVAISFVALWLTASFRQDGRGLGEKLGIAAVMGVAIPVMHYTGMAAVSYGPMGMPLDLRHAVEIDALARPAIIVTTLVLLLAVLVTSVVDRRLSKHRGEAEFSRNLFRQVVQRAPDPIFIYDRETLAILVMNESATRLFEVPAESAAACTMTDILPGRELRTPGEAEEIAHLQKDGTRFEAELRFVPVEWKTGPAVMLIALDMTERRALERERDSMLTQLRQAQMLESVGQFAAGLAYEVQTPVQSIAEGAEWLGRAFAELAPWVRQSGEVLSAVAAGVLSPELRDHAARLSARQGSEYLAEEMRETLALTGEGCERVAALVGAMREFSQRDTAGKARLNLNRAIENTITVARHEWKYVAEVRTDFDLLLPPVPCLRETVHQVILHLIVNAARAIAEVVGNGGEEMGIITLRTRQVEGYAEVQVEDTGAGIPRSAQSGVFDPFSTGREGAGARQQGANTARSRGLAMAHRAIVNKHGGTLRFTTEEGRGTTFFLRLPLEPVGAEQPAKRMEPAAAGVAARR